MTFDLPATPSKDTFDDRVIRNGIAVKRCTYIGAGFGGLILLMSPGDVLRDAPPIFVPAVITLIVLGVACLGRAYVPFVMASETLNGRLNQAGAAIRLSGVPLPAYQEQAHRFYVVSVLFLIVASIVLLVALWWGVALPSANPTPVPHQT